MRLAIVAEVPPLGTDPTGTVRVGGTRVPLDTVILSHRQGATPEQIVEMFDVLKLADVYATIANYLAHQPEVDAYLQTRAAEGARVRQENEARFDTTELHARLLGHLNERKR